MQTTRPNTPDIDQWRAVFARVEGVLESESKINVQGHRTERVAVPTNASSSAATGNYGASTDDIVDSVVRRWRESTLLNTPTAGHALLDDFSSVVSLTQPKSDLVLGHYRLLERIGQGGMGSVWRAERTDGLYDGEVAIKLLGSLALSAHARARFAQEGQILARLKHPNIAGLLDAGITDDGQRYLVIELIDGVAINDYVEKHSLNVPQRLQLFRQLLDAVAFAHERLVIHRDIKPANILVTVNGSVKLLDFGVAKLLVEGEDTSLTQVHGSAYTEAYASPEQIGGDAPTVVADVFSLGMILLELLSGKRATWANPKRKVNPGDYPKQLADISPPDLRAIVRKALEVAPEERYRAIAAFDDDVRRFLANEPVAAHTAGAGYGIKKFLRRHTLAVGATSAVIAALIVGATAATWQWREARAQAARAEAVQAFTVRMFAENDPENAQGKVLSAKDMLDRGAARVVAELKDRPDVLAELQERIGFIYNSMGEHARARPHLENAVALFETANRVHDSHYFDALYSLVEALGDEQKLDAMKTVAEKLRLAARTSQGEPNKWLGKTLGQTSWAATSTGDAVKGESLAREALAQQLAYAKSPDAEWFSISSNLIEALVNQGKFLEAREISASKVAQGASVAEYSLTDRMVDRYTLARMDFVLNRQVAALLAVQPLVDQMGRHLGVTHQRTMNARNLLAQSLVGAGFYDEGVAVQHSNVRTAYAREVAKDTEDHEAAAFEELVLAKLLVMSQPEVAESYATKGLTFFEKKYERPTWNRERARWILSDSVLHRRATPSAEAQLATTITNMQALPEYAGHTSYADALQTRALLRTAQARYDEAATDIAAACPIFEKRLPTGAAQTTYCKFYALWIGAHRAPRAESPEALAKVKARMLELIPPTHRSFDAMVAMLTLLERGVVPVIATDGRDAIWPISLSDVSLRARQYTRCGEVPRDSARGASQLSGVKPSSEKCK